MTDPRRPTDFFGIPVGLERRTAELLYHDLQAAWAGLGPGLPHGVVEGVDWLFKKYFDPRARGQRLRSALEAVDAPLPKALFATDDLVIDLGASRGLITPEGRVAIWVLERCLAGTATSIVIDDESLFAAESFLLDRYRTRSRARLEQVVRLAQGAGRPMLPAAAAIPLLLLVNRSTAPDRALRRPKPADQRRELDEAIGAVIAAFARTIDTPSTPRSRERSLDHMSLYGGYPLTEARRRLGAQLSPDPGELYVRPGQEDGVLRFVASDLARRELRIGRIEEAFDAMVSSYRAQYPILAALRVAYERPADTQRLRAGLLAEYGRACPTC